MGGGVEDTPDRRASTPEPAFAAIPAAAGVRRQPGEAGDGAPVQLSEFRRPGGQACGNRGAEHGRRPHPAAEARGSLVGRDLFGDFRLEPAAPAAEKPEHAGDVAASARPRTWPRRWRPRAMAAARSLAARREVVWGAAAALLEARGPSCAAGGGHRRAAIFIAHRFQAFHGRMAP